MMLKELPPASPGLTAPTTLAAPAARTPAAAASQSKLDAALEGFTPSEHSAVLAMRFRDPQTTWEWTLWDRLQRRFAQLLSQ